MQNLKQNTATICVVNYKTLDLTRLCLRSIRKFTDYPYKVLVVDNNSQDKSTDYLKGLKWIQLVERFDKTNDSSGGYAHAAALDMALDICDTEYFIAMHSDTFVHKHGWLGELMKFFEEKSNIACVGGGKCEIENPFRRFFKMISDFKTIKRKMLCKADPIGMYRYYNRTVCSIYKTEVLKREKLSFLMDRDKGLTVGKKLYFELVDRGYKTIELPDSFMKKYIWHLAHATQVINKGEFNISKRTQNRINRVIDKLLNSNEVKEISGDSSLDN